MEINHEDIEKTKSKIRPGQAPEDFFNIKFMIFKCMFDIKNGKTNERVRTDKICSQ